MSENVKPGRNTRQNNYGVLASETPFIVTEKEFL